MFKIIRVTILLLILGSVASTVLLQRNVSSDWTGTLDIRIIPVFADETPETANYIKNLTQRNFDNIERYLIQQAAAYKTDLTHGLNIQLSEPIYDIPSPAPPPDAGTLEIILWSLSLRWWAWQNQPDDYHDAQIRLYVLYQNPDFGIALPHSTGLRNGLIGLINARVNGSSARFHNVVITHELLHIFGAQDKYDLSNGQPSYPYGYADPDLTPLHPQQKAELMGRAIALSETRHEVARRLTETTIGMQTAQEIGWVN